MENNKRNAPASGLPPEFGPRAPAEYRAPGAEFAPLPPEFDQHGGAAEAPARKKRRSLRYFLVLPILALLALLVWKPGPAKASAMPEPELPEGTVVIDLVRAGVSGDKVYYAYDLFTPIPSLDATEEQMEEYKNGTPWPVTVYAKVTDASGGSAAPAADPDQWDGPRELQDYEIDVAGLQGDLTLTLLALYTENGAQRQTVLTVPLEVLPAEPTLIGELTVYPGGDVDAVFRFLPAPGDTHDYQLQTIRAGQEVHGGEDGLMGLSLVNDPIHELPVTGDSKNGYEVRYSGGSGAAFIPKDTQLTLYVVLQDATDGKEYVIGTNPVDPVERVYEYPVYPLGDGNIVITVFNDTTIFEFPDFETAEDGYRTLLDSVTIPEAEFAYYDVPSAWTPNGYEFLGWAVHVGNPLDPGGDIESIRGYNGDPPVEAMVSEGSFAFQVYGQLTKENVERVPPSEDGNRYINLHAVWTMAEPENPLLILNDGMGGSTAYDMMVPLASEGFLYLCNYPTPLSSGHEFDGWYDENGNRVDMLVCYFSFTPVVYDSEGNFAGYDWNSEKSVTLTAHWK